MVKFLFLQPQIQDTYINMDDVCKSTRISFFLGFFWWSLFLDVNLQQK